MRSNRLTVCLLIMLTFSLAAAPVRAAESSGVNAPAATTPAEADGALSPEVLREIRRTFKMDADSRVLHNAITNNDINALALNRGALKGQDGHFSHKIETKGVTDQQSSGRCWMFAGFNTMRPKVIRDKKLPEFEFSAAYLQFWDKMEKSNLYLEQMIRMRDTDFLDREWELAQRWSLGDGGWWNYVVELIDKYGVVPQDVMPETQSSNNTRTMNRVLERMLRVHAVKMHAMHRDGKKVADLRAYKTEAMADVYRFLALNLGEPPTEFEWRYETKDKDDDDDAAKGDAGDSGKPDTVVDNLTPPVKYTPKSFYRQFVGVPLEDFVCLYHDPTNPYGKRYQFKDARNMAGARDMDFVNLPIDVLKKTAMQSVMANQPLWFAADMGKDQSTKHGLMADRLFDYGPMFGVDVRLSKADRLRYRAGGSNHAMVFMGVDVRDGKPVKWLVENSWGDDKGKKGTWTLYDDWFNEHVYCVIVDRRFVSDDVLKVFNEKPTVLPPWYPGAMGIE